MNRSFYKVGFSGKAGEVHAIFGLLKFDGQTVINQDILSKKEQDISRKFKAPKRNLQFLAGRKIAKDCILKLYPNHQSSSISIDHGVWGFPYINSKNIAQMTISIAHTDNYAAVLIVPSSAYPCGIDIEEVSTTHVKALEKLMTQKELKLVQKLSISAVEGLHLLWAAKEAAGKVLKVGFHIAEENYEIASLTKRGKLFHIQFVQLQMISAVGWLDGDLCHCLAFPTLLEFKSIEGVKTNEK